VKIGCRNTGCFVESFGSLDLIIYKKKKIVIKEKTLQKKSSLNLEVIECFTAINSMN
jgi:NADH:ubiquinone oxidoreductase subunit E